MADGLRKGYTVAGSNTGHEGDSLYFGANKPESIRDWAYRSTHVLAQGAKEILASFYDRAPRHSYFVGCSTGGQQALSEAQRYPTDFDGIIAGDPGNDRIRLNVDFLKSWETTHPVSGPPFPATKLSMLNKAAVLACDKQDGVADGVIADPTKCSFDPATLKCETDHRTADCLTDLEIGMVRQLYDGAVRDARGKPLYFGWPRGSEAGWGSYFISPPQPARLEFWNSWVFDQGTSTLSELSAEELISAARTKLPYVEAVDPDLRKFLESGGKLLIYQGWADPVVPAGGTVAYYQEVLKSLGPTTAASVRLFMVPGMGHCNGGPGASNFDALEALDKWVTGAGLPERIIASHVSAGDTKFTRPLCPYPLSARWTGHDDPSQASSYRCGSK